MSTIFTDIFNEGNIPERLKTSNTIFLRKKPEALKHGDFRPICLVPVFLKLLDKIFSARYSTYMSENKLWAEEQHAYAQGRSTTTALFEVLGRIEQALAEKN